MLHLITSEPASLEDYEQVALDEAFIPLPPHASGFYTEGVSAGIVFVVYHQNELILMHHWGNIPSSTASNAHVKVHAKIKLDQIEEAITEAGYNASACIVYALGGQPSSQNLVNVLRSLQEKGYAEFVLDTEDLDLIGNDEDTFDLFVPRGAPRFEVKIDQAQPPAPLLNAYITSILASDRARRRTSCLTGSLAKKFRN